MTPNALARRTRSEDALLAGLVLMLHRLRAHTRGESPIYPQEHAQA